MSAPYRPVISALGMRKVLVLGISVPFWVLISLCPRDTGAHLRVTRSVHAFAPPRSAGQRGASAAQVARARQPGGREGPPREVAHHPRTGLPDQRGAAVRPALRRGPRGPPVRVPVVHA